MHFQSWKKGGSNEELEPVGIDSGDGALNMLLLEKVELYTGRSVESEFIRVEELVIIDMLVMVVEGLARDQKSS